MALALGRGADALEGKLTAAACIQPPLVFGCAAENIKTIWNGFIDRRTGNRYRDTLRKNIDVLKPAYEKIGIDAEKFFETFQGVMEFEEQINWKVLKEADCASYYRNSSGATYIEHVKVPTFIYFIEDDPIIDRRCIPVEKIIQNENIMVGYNRHGAHLCSHEHFFTTDQWFFKPAFEFLHCFLESEEKQRGRLPDSDNLSTCRNPMAPHNFKNNSAPFPDLLEKSEKEVQSQGARSISYSRENILHSIQERENVGG